MEKNNNTSTPPPPPPPPRTTVLSRQVTTFGDERDTDPDRVEAVRRMEAVNTAYQGGLVDEKEAQTLLNQAARTKGGDAGKVAAFNESSAPVVIRALNRFGLLGFDAASYRPPASCKGDGPRWDRDDRNPPGAGVLTVS